MKKIMALVLGLAILPCGHAVGGVITDMNVISSNGDYSNSQDLDLYVLVSSHSVGTVTFEVHNASSLSSSAIDGIYIDDALGLLSSPQIMNTSGTDYRDKATPKKMGGSITFDTDFSFGPKNNAPVNGVNSGEYVGLSFETGSTDWDDILSAVNTSQLRLGMHVIALPDGSSEWAVNTPTTMPVPEPATVALLAVGGLLITRCKRKTARKL